jgi:DNA-directed RNA polymerase subunit RPC12/RpoP
VGALLELRCAACGYERQLSVGVGMLGVTLEPYLCRSCGELVNVPVDNVHDPSDARLGRCPDCGSRELEPWTYEPEVSEHDPAGSPTARARCPRCRGAARLTSVGIWD